MIVFFIISAIGWLVVCVSFNYMHYDKKHGPIYKSIEALDKMGMDIIETGDPEAFKRYLSEYDNTICGRHPISVFLHVSALHLYIVPSMYNVAAELHENKFLFGVNLTFSINVFKWIRCWRTAQQR